MRSLNAKTQRTPSSPRCGEPDNLAPSASLRLGFSILVPLLAAAWLGAAEPQIVLLKLDDMHDIYPAYQRVADFAIAEGIKINFGVFGSALEKEDARLIPWIVKMRKTGSFEFWNHAYKSFPSSKENEGTGYEAQRTSIGRSQELSLQRLGEPFIAFGPHAGATDGDTWKVLNEHPEIKLVWYYSPPKGMTADHAFIVERKLNMEQPTTKMNKDKFIADYEAKGTQLEYIALQGHPNAWNDDMFQQFKDVALYLKGKGCRFMTMSEFLATRKKPGK